MNTLGTWVLSIAGIVLFGTVLDLLLTKSRLKPFIRSIFAVITVLVVVTPIPAFIKSGFDADFDFGKIDLDESFLEYTENAKLNAIAYAVEKALAQDGIVGASVTVEGDADGLLVRNVTVNLTDSVIDGGEPHINKYAAVKKKVSIYLDIDEEQVSVYG